MRTKILEENRVVLEGVDEFKYLNYVLNNIRGCTRTVIGRVKTAWGSFKELGGLLCGMQKLGLKHGRCLRDVLKVFWEMGWKIEVRV